MVKNKNGFIASSLMFSFFLVFILLSVLVLSSYSHYNQLIKSLNGTILTGLNNTIAAKYAGIKNLVQNGKVEKTSNPWSLSSGARYVKQTDNNNEFLQILPNTTGSISQSFSNIPGGRVIYVAFNFNSWYPDDCTSCTFSVSLNGKAISKFYYIDKNDDDRFVGLQPNALVNNDEGSHNQNWILYGGILRTTSTVNQIKFEASGLKYYIENAGGVFGINNIVVADITNLYKDNQEANDSTMINYLLRELPFIDYEQKYSLPKI